MKSLYLKADSYTTVTQEADPNDDWDRDNTSTDWSVNLDNVYYGNPFYEDVTTNYNVKLDLEPIENQKLQIIYAIWGTGDSFGYDDGYYCQIVFVSQDKQEAKDWLDKAKKATNDYFKYPWLGYFENLEKIELIECVVKYD